MKQAWNSNRVCQSRLVPRHWWIRSESWTQLRAEGYGISASHQDADLVVVNTPGFIDSRGG
ncbi:MAG: hypothetical protein R3E95_18090 [Thiolinea sp.]